VNAAQAGGRFGVNITGNATATLSDINRCALEVSAFVRDPANWINDPDKTYHFTRFLRNDHPAPLFANCSGCAAVYLSTGDHKLSLYGSGWVCPTSTGAVVGTATRQATASCSSIFAALIACIVISRFMFNWDSDRQR